MKATSFSMAFTWLMLFVSRSFSSPFSRHRHGNEAPAICGAGGAEAPAAASQFTLQSNGDVQY